MHTSTITVNVSLDQDKVPDQIEWKATDSTAAEFQKARAMMISFWDGADKSALRVDLWTKEMMVDEMADFFYQTMSAMADTYLRATQQQELSDDLKNFAKEFYHKFRKTQEQQNS